jgi:HEAT repeat protein/energy-coupling factor transporter ATP-binding protein EcfA2
MTRSDPSKSTDGEIFAPPGTPSAAPQQISTGGNSSVAAGSNATHNATGKGSSVQDNRTYIILNDSNIAGDSHATENDLNEAVNAYAEQIRITYGRLDLEALIPTTEGEHPRVELCEVFVPPLLRADPPPVELPVELHRHLIESGEITDDKVEPPKVPGMSKELWEQARQAYKERPAVDLLETLAAAESGRTVLLGDPGSGKSTLTRYMALSLTSGTLSGPLEPLSGLLPVIIELRRYADADWREKSFEDFLSYMHRQEGNAPSPELLKQCLKNGKSLVIFDGLDELFDPRIRDAVTQRIKGFSGRYPDARLVVTSRVIGYNRHTLDAAGFRHYMIQSLDSDQISDFTQRWYRTVCIGNSREAERLENRLSEAIARSRPVRELASNPLLLTILAIIARRQRLPRDRAGVYQHAVNVLIAHWDEDTKHLDLTADIRPIADLDDRDRREMLERLARHMQGGEGGIAGNNVLGEEIERVFTEYLRETLQLELAPSRKVARAMVKQLRERNFILSLYGGQVYGFVHRAFLEYLAASDIVRRYEQRELTEEDLFDGIFVQRSSDPAWHEVLLLIVGQLGERVAGPAVEKILTLTENRDTQRVAPPAVLALRALSEVRRVGVLREQSIETAIELTRYWNEFHVVPVNVTVDTDMSLYSLGPQWAGATYLRRWIHASGGGIRSSTVVYDLFSDIDVLLVIASHAWQAAARAGALPYLAKKWPNEERVLDLARDHALNDVSGIVRSDALDVLADHWTNNPSTRELIQARALEDPDGYVRRWAISTLVRYWSNESTVHDLVKQQAAEDQDKSVRSNALTALTHHWADDPSTVELLQSCATRDIDEDVRTRALVTLTEHWFYDPSVRELVRIRAAQDPHEDVRASALMALARNGADDPSVRGFIEERITADAHQMVRSTAGAALAEYWTEEFGVRQLIQARVTEDPDEHGRSRFLETLVDYWAEDPSVREIVLTCVAEDPHEHVRSDALDTLAEKWSEDPSVRELIEQHAISDPHHFIRRWAIAALVLHWVDQDSLELIMGRAMNDPHKNVRMSSILTLADNWPDDHAVRELIIERSTQDSDEEVRRGAHVVVKSRWSEEPNAEEIIQNLRERACQSIHDDGGFLREAITQAPNPKVRIEAARILASLWAADPHTVPLLQEQIERETDQEVCDAMPELVAMAEAYAGLHDRLW